MNDCLNFLEPEIQLPKTPGNQFHLNVVVAFTGIVFLFYSEKKRRKYQGKNEDENCLIYCWDLVFSGELFQSDRNEYVVDYSECLLVNTDENWCHFIAEKTCAPFHFKIALSDEIPAAMSMVHLGVYHCLIKQYIRECLHEKLAPDIEMLILDYFPMFL